MISVFDAMASAYTCSFSEKKGMTLLLPLGNESSRPIKSLLFALPLLVSHGNKGLSLFVIQIVSNLRNYS